MTVVSTLLAALAACGPATIDEAAMQSVTVAVSPPTAQVAPGGTRQFAAAVSGAADTAVTWSVAEAGGGSVDGAGTYTAPGSSGTFHVVATSVADPAVSALAEVLVSATPPSVSVTVSPLSTAVSAGGTVQFTATVTGSSDTAVTWSVVEAGGGSVSATGLYTAPATSGTWHVRATSRADPARSATATVGVTVPGGGGGRFVTGYWASWTAGNMVSYPYTVIDWTALTHVAVAFAYPSTGGALSYQGGNLSSSLARQVTAAAHANGRKAILMIGGVGSAATFAAATGNTAASAQAFAQRIADFARPDGFDGVDLDWEGIWAGANGSPGDDVRMKNLALALRAIWPDVVLTVAMGWDQTGQGFWSGMKDASGNWLFDQFNVMTYDAANGWPSWVSWFHNALDDAAANRPSSIAKALGELAAVGVPKARIGMGLPFYGSAWTGSAVYGPRQAMATNYNAATQGADITWTYKYIVDNYLKPYDGPDPTDAAGRTMPDGVHTGYIFDPKAGVGYVTGGTAGFSLNGRPAINFLSFEDPTSIATKGAWLKANGFGGAIIWLINEGATDSSGTNPLLSAVKTAVLQ
jgi:chitinase